MTVAFRAGRPRLRRPRGAGTAARRRGGDEAHRPAAGRSRYHAPRPAGHHAGRRRHHHQRRLFTHHGTVHRARPRAGARGGGVPGRHPRHAQIRPAGEAALRASRTGAARGRSTSSVTRNTVIGKAGVMSEIPAGLKYTREHEWVRREPDGSLVVGITDHAQEELGELVYVDPELGGLSAATPGRRQSPRPPPRMPPPGDRRDQRHMKARGWFSAPRRRLVCALSPRGGRIHEAARRRPRRPAGGTAAEAPRRSCRSYPMRRRGAIWPSVPAASTSCSEIPAAQVAGLPMPPGMTEAAVTRLLQDRAARTPARSASSAPVPATITFHRGLALATRGEFYSAHALPGPKREGTLQLSRIPSCSRPPASLYPNASQPATATAFAEAA